MLVRIPKSCQMLLPPRKRGCCVAGRKQERQGFESQRRGSVRGQVTPSARMSHAGLFLVKLARFTQVISVAAGLGFLGFTGS